MLSPCDHTLTKGGQPVDLTAKEFDLLQLLINHRGKVYSREALLETVWKYDYMGDMRTVDVHIRRLREKIERDSAGYVKRAQIGNMDYTGDEVRDSLGLSSSCFYFSSADGKIRVSSKGIGSGYGFSQAGADAMEREQGSAFQELLKYYFQGIEIVKIAE